MHLLILVVVAAALVLMQVLKGGWVFAFSLPAYGLLALGGLVSWYPLRRFELPRKSLLPLATAGVFFGYILLRTVLSPVEAIARSDLFTALGALVLYLLVAFYATSPRLRAWLVAVLLVLACANGIVATIQYFKGDNFMVFGFLPRADYGNRASGFFGNPNHLAGFLEIASLLGLGMAWWGRWKLWGRVVAGYAALMGAAAILITGSRGGYASTLAGLFVFVLLSFTVRDRKNRGNFWIVALAIVVLAVTLAVTVFAVVKGSDVLQTRVEGASADVPFRASLWKAGLRQFTVSPIFGTGSATYLYYGRMFREPGVQSDPIYTHSDYLQLLGEFGLVGFLGFLAFLAAHLRTGWLSIVEMTRHFRASRLAGGSNSLALTIGAMSCVGAFLVHSAVDFNLHIPANALAMALVFGLLANPGSIPVSSRTGAHDPTFALPFAARLVPPALGVWILVAGIPLSAGAYYAYRTERVLSDWKYMDSPELARETEQLVRRGLEHDPRNPELYRALGDVQFALGLLSSSFPDIRREYLNQCIESYRQALALAPMDRNLVLALAWTFDEMRQFPESAPLYQRALELDPHASQVHSAYGGHLELQGRIDEAKKEYQRAADTGSFAAHHALERLAREPKPARTGAENDAPKIGR